MNVIDRGQRAALHATLQGTSAYFRRQALPVSPIPFGRTELFVSPVGFGGYRIEESEPSHREALELALLSGCNLIDTSANYTGGSSERLIGSAIASLLRDGKLQRDEIVLVTKAGYVQGPNLEAAQRREAEGQPFPEMVKYRPECWHCIAPEFLEDQLTRSLERLGVTTVDVFLLHNPEYFLKTSSNHAEYYARIRKAFAHLEAECRRGRIRWYGVSSNTFPCAKDDPEFTSLETLLEIARETSPDHRFGVIQFPLNLFEPGAVLEENNSHRSVAALAREHRLATLVNRPLNSFHDEQLLRLADFPSHENEDVVGSLKEAWSRAMELEQEYPNLAGKEPLPVKPIAWGHMIRQNFSRLSEIDVWLQTLRWQIRPSLVSALDTLLEKPKFHEWARAYGEVSSALFEAITNYLESQASHRSDQIAALLDHAIPPIQTSKTLSRKVIRLYRSIPGIDCVLVGMRRPEYVRDTLALDLPLPASPALQAWQAVLDAQRETEH